MSNDKYIIHNYYDVYRVSQQEKCLSYPPDCVGGVTESPNCVGGKGAAPF